jgi:glycogen operon protein
VNFYVFSKNCSAPELLLFDDVDAPRPTRVIRLDPQHNQTFYYWHIFAPGLHAGQLYDYRAYGPFQPHAGFRFDPSKVQLDPYVRGAYNWEEDTPLASPYASTFITRQAERW